MGTSQSSRGPGGGVPLVPPWVPPPPGDTDGAPPGQGDQTAPPGAPPATLPAAAAAARFGSSRLSLGKFAKSGDRSLMRRGVSEYIAKGYGGRAAAARRLEGTARTAGSLHGALSGL